MAKNTNGKLLEYGIGTPLKYRNRAKGTSLSFSISLADQGDTLINMVLTSP